MMPQNRFSDLFAEADAAFEGRYQTELDSLTGLSRAEIDAITPCTQDLRMYSVLLKVVEQASRENLSQAELLGNIRELGDTAVRIARKVPSFAALL